MLSFSNKCPNIESLTVNLEIDNIENILEEEVGEKESG
jgi:hypothetical protein